MVCPTSANTILHKRHKGAERESCCSLNRIMHPFFKKHILFSKKAYPFFREDDLFFREDDLFFREDDPFFVKVVILRQSKLVGS